MTNEQTPPPIKLLAKLAAIFAKVESLPKDGKNEHFNYRFATEASAKRVLHPLFAEQRIVLKVDVLAAEIVVRQSHDKSGEPKEITKITLAYAFIDCESGESLSGQFMGYGEDSNDKGVWKAVTGCVKYILFETFLIPTGDDPDNDPEPPKPPAAKPKGPTYYGSAAKNPPPAAPVKPPVAVKADVPDEGWMKGAMKINEKQAAYSYMDFMKEVNAPPAEINAVNVFFKNLFSKPVSTGDGAV